jgi:uncharacterized protein
MFINRRAFLRLAGGATMAAGGAIAGYAIAFEPNNLILERKQVRLPKLPNAFDGFRIVLLTDLHPHPSNLVPWTVEISNALKPDLVLLGGQDAGSAVMGNDSNRSGILLLNVDGGTWKKQ